jgi:hypothetical protein
MGFPSLFSYYFIIEKGLLELSIIYSKELPELDQFSMEALLNTSVRQGRS